MGNQVNLDDLKRIRVLQQVSVETLEYFLPEIEKIALTGDEVLLSPLQPNQFIYGLLDGELLIRLQAGDNRVIARIKPGDCVGEISIVDDNPPSAYVVTSGSCELISIHRDVLTRMFEKEAELAVNLLKLLGERFRQNNDYLAANMELLEEYRNKAERDGLTGLHNRAWMNDVFPRQLELSARIGQPVTLMMIDADNFKQVNDNHGHQIGDEALQHLSTIIADNLRETDLLVRYGGEELMVLMPGTLSAYGRVVAERVRTMVMSSPLVTRTGLCLNLTISMGLSQWRDEEEMNSLIGRADRALYQAKSEGKNCISILN